jgi:hypothetical protein
VIKNATSLQKKIQPDLPKAAAGKAQEIVDIAAGYAVLVYLREKSFRLLGNPYEIISADDAEKEVTKQLPTVVQYVKEHGKLPGYAELIFSQTPPLGR